MISKLKIATFLIGSLLSTSMLFGQNRKTVVLTFDDAPASHYNYVAPLLKKYKFPATFYVYEFPGVYPDSTKGMNWRQIQSISKMGFEIGNHTAHHVTLNAGNEAAELKYVDLKCDSLGIPRPTSFAYPGYAVDSSCFEVLKRNHYSSARVGGDRTYNIKSDVRYLIPSFAITDGNPNLFYEALEKADQVNVVVFCFHGVPDISHPWINTKPEVFAAYMEYLKKNKFKVISMKELRISKKKHGFYLMNI